MRSLPRKKRSQEAGFTLLELIIVIVILGIMAISLSNLSKDAVLGYVDAKDRNRFSQSTKWIIERISREIREALPQSVRVSSNGINYCVEFMAINNASSYLDLPSTGIVSTFKVVGYDLTPFNATKIAIMPINPGEVYNESGVLGNIVSITNLTTPAADVGKAQVVIDPTTFSRRSPTNRFYLLKDPVSFCLNNTNGRLTRHQDYGINSTQNLTPNAGSLMGEDLSVNGFVFNYQSDTLSRAGLLQMNFRAQSRNRNLSGNEESFEIFHEVHIRNVP